MYKINFSEFETFIWNCSSCGMTTTTNEYELTSCPFCGEYRITKILATKESDYENAV